MTSTEIRDPVHGSIAVDRDELAIIDHPWMQRLRHVRQLGFVGLVYPGAVHDRFQHSCGVMHLAGSLFDALFDGRSAAASYAEADRRYGRRILRLAGLLHDVGHPPFSHSTEAFLPPIEVVHLPSAWYRDGRRPLGRRATHEDLGLAVIHALSVDGLLDAATAQDVAAVLSPDVRRSPRLAALGGLVGILRALVAGELDADRGDYLLRDSHFTGVSYGLYDLPRLRESLLILEGPEGPELGIDAHGVHVLEHLLLARYHMFRQVYFHKTPPGFEHFLEQALAEGEVTLALDRGLPDLAEARDDGLLAQWHRAAARGAPWSRRITGRHPPALVLRQRLGRDEPESFLANDLVAALGEAGCTVFSRRSSQRFTRLAAGGAQGERLLCQRRLLGRSITEPVGMQSDLLAAFNQPIDLVHTYVLHEDADRARAVIDRQGGWMG